MGQYSTGASINDGGTLGFSLGATQLPHRRRRERTMPAAPPEVEWLLPMPSGAPRDGGVERRTIELGRWIDAFDMAARRLPRQANAGVPGMIRAPRSRPAASLPLRSPPETANTTFRMEGDEPEANRQPSTRLGGTQAVTRALDILFAIAERPMMLAELAAHVELNQTTTYRLATALVARGLLSTSGRSGYALGDRVGELGASLAEQRASLARK